MIQKVKIEIMEYECIIIIYILTYTHCSVIINDRLSLIDNGNRTVARNRLRLFRIELIVSFF